MSKQGRTLIALSECGVKLIRKGTGMITATRHFQKPEASSEFDFSGELYVLSVPSVVRLSLVSFSQRCVFEQTEPVLLLIANVFRHHTVQVLIPL